MKLSVDRTRVIRAALTAALAIGALTALGCGDDNKGSDNKGRFDVSGKVDRFAGPTPLIARLKASSKNAVGDVRYRWRFDDGTSSTSEEVVHKFTRAGYYQVILDGRDESGNNDRESFLFGAWPPKQWATAQSTPLTKKGARTAQRVQQQRTDERRAALRKVLRQRAREQIEG
jgi:hypothetical protein